MVVENLCLRHKGGLETPAHSLTASPALSTDNSRKFEAHTPAQPRSRFHSGFFLPCGLSRSPPLFWDRSVDALKILSIAVRFWEFSFALGVVPSLSNRYTAKEIEHSYTTTHLA